MNLEQRFVAFFEAANDGRCPYRWQIELVERVAQTGSWPHIAAPTGAGKSAVIDAHVFLVAEHARGATVARPPRRLVLVAPHRAILDEHHERATRLSDLLAMAAPDDSLARTETALWTLVTCEIDDPAGSPLLVWRVDGGGLRAETGWRLDPAACQVICTTPRMWGSRLLLRGDGATRLSRNLEAGLLSHDAVAVIDQAEAHERLVETAMRVAAYSRGPAVLQVAALRTTGARRPAQLTLSDADLTDPPLARRLNATKRVTQVVTDDFSRPVGAVVDAARAAAGRGTVCVFVNDAATAIAVAAALRDAGATVELVCERLRAVDLQRLRGRRPGLLTAAGDPEVEFLVSTQSLQDGVDLDLPAIVSLLAPASALAARSGRLNRSGRFDDATMTVVVPADPAAITRSGPYGQAELVGGLEWLRRLGGSIACDRIWRLGLPDSSRPALPALRRVDLQTLAMTSDPLAADPDPALYLQDLTDAQPRVGIAARRHLDLSKRVVAAMLRACPPLAHEIATMPLGKDLDRVLAVVRAKAWLMRSASGEVTAVPLADRRPRPGDVIVVPSGSPICADGVVDVRGAKRGSLDDVLAAAPPDTPRDYVVRLPTEAMAAIVRRDPALGTRAGRRAVAHVLVAAGGPQLAAPVLRERLADVQLTWCGDEARAHGALVVSDMRRRAEQTPAIVPSEQITLAQHQAQVSARVAKIAAALRLDSDELGDQALKRAARWHDEGKRHPRFQRRIGANGVPLAYPLPGHRPDRGDGWRHEQLSAAFAAQHTDGDPLTIALVAAHHGSGRPLFDRDDAALLDAWTDCPPDVRSWLTRLYGPGGCYELIRGQAERVYGVHGLAWREALIRCADMQVAREAR